MQRKQFLFATMAATPLFSFSELLGKKNGIKKLFMIKGGKSRFNEVTKLGPNANDIKVSRKDTNNQLSVFEYRGYEKSGPPLHVHFSQDEIFQVTEGSYRCVVGEEQMQLNVGDTIFLPRNIPHTWIQLTDKGRLVYLVQPAGTMEEFFRQMGALTQPPTQEQAQKIHTAHGMKVVGPPLSL
jgi:quercetin dioxygenase-like cupin family protein